MWIGCAFAACGNPVAWKLGNHQGEMSLHRSRGLLGLVSTVRRGQPSRWNCGRRRRRVGGYSCRCWNCDGRNIPELRSGNQKNACKKTLVPRHSTRFKGGGLKTKLDSAARFPPRQAWTSWSKAFSFKKQARQPTGCGACFVFGGLRPLLHAQHATVGSNRIDFRPMKTRRRTTTESDKC